MHKLCFMLRSSLFDKMKTTSFSHYFTTYQRYWRNVNCQTRLKAQLKDNPDAKRVYTTGIVDLPERADLDSSQETRVFGIAASQGPRDTMEDEAVVFPDGKCGFMYTMVLDGHDGLDAVQWLSENLFAVFSNVIDENLFSGACDIDQEDTNTGLCCPRELNPPLIESFHAADTKLLKRLQEIGGVKAAKSGSTATVALIRENKIIVANVGDSRLVLCRNGKALDLTTEHRVYGKGPSVLSEIERVESVGGWIDDGRVCGLLAVSRAFGDWELKGEGLQSFLEDSILEGALSDDFVSNVHFTGDPLVCTPDVTELDLTRNDDFVIIATDGLWDVLPSVDAIRFVQRQFKKGMSVQKVTESLVDLANKRYTADNVAVIIIDLCASQKKKNNKEISETLITNSNKAKR